MMDLVLIKGAVVHHDNDEKGTRLLIIGDK
jgi:hypothetical protein